MNIFFKVAWFQILDEIVRCLHSGKWHSQIWEDQVAVTMTTNPREEPNVSGWRHKDVDRRRTGACDLHALPTACWRMQHAFQKGVGSVEAWWWPAMLDGSFQCPFSTVLDCKIVFGTNPKSTWEYWFGPRMMTAGGKRMEERYRVRERERFAV